jgi:hypothetical protein
LGPPLGSTVTTVVLLPVDFVVLEVLDELDDPCPVVVVVDVDVVVDVQEGGDSGIVIVFVWPSALSVNVCVGVRREDVRWTSVPLPG